jgi:hypothetical protein
MGKEAQHTSWLEVFYNYIALDSELADKAKM